MGTEEVLHEAEVILADLATSFSRPEANRLDVVLPKENLKMAVKTLVVEKMWGYLSAITGLDHPEYEVVAETNEKRVVADKGNIELLYHLCSGAAITTLRVTVPYSDPVIDTVCDIIPSASLFEREVIELFGVSIPETPIQDHLILPDSWPAGVYPLRKAFTGLEKKQEREVRE